MHDTLGLLADKQRVLAHAWEMLNNHVQHIFDKQKTPYGRSAMIIYNMLFNSNSPIDSRYREHADKQIIEKILKVDERSELRTRIRDAQQQVLKIINSAAPYDVAQSLSEALADYFSLEDTRYA